MMPDGPRNTLRKSQAQRQKHKEMGKEGGMMVELSTENYRIQIQCHIFFSRVFLVGIASIGLRLAGLLV